MSFNFLSFVSLSVLYFWLLRVMLRTRSQTPLAPEAMYQILTSLSGNTPAYDSPNPLEMKRRGDWKARAWWGGMYNFHG